MFNETLENLGSASKAKESLCNESVFKYFLLSVMAGVYIGFGVILVYVLAAPFNEIASPSTKLIMSVTFSIALCLVLFAGAELFTGNTMSVTVGLLRKDIRLAIGCKLLLICYAGNLAGSVLIAAAAVAAGIFNAETVSIFIVKISELKMGMPPHQLFLRAIFCNMIVCLAIWMSFKVRDEAAKVLLVILCIIAFFASGFEHSIANMSTLAIALFIPHPVEISPLGYFYNIIICSIGNLIGGSLFIGGFYYYVGSSK